MNKIVIASFLALIVSACNNNAKTEQELQKQRDSIDAAQHIKDSLEVEARMLKDMEADTPDNDKSK